MTRIYSGAFYKTAWYDNQPNGIVYAGKVAYEYKGIMPENTELKLDDGTLSISDSAFSFCRGLKSIAIPNSVTSIGDCAIGKVQYPQSQENYFKDNFYAFPSPGYCPQQIISPGNSAWNIGTKPELLTYINTEDVTVTVTNLNTGKEFVRTVKDNTVRVSEDSIEFAQPDDYDQNSYRYKDNYFTGV